MLDNPEEPSPRVLVVDSGVGGLSICREIRRQVPNARLVFVADNEWFPYGSRDPATLAERVLAIIRTVPSPIDLVVVGCNTASTAVLPLLRERVGVPVVGVVPAIKPAAANSRSRTIGLLATPGTVTRPYVDDLIKQFAADCQVVRLGSERLVHIAEAHLRGTPPDSQELLTILAPLLANPELDTVVLGCTHFPLIADHLAAAAPPTIGWIHSGPAIAHRVAALTSHVRRTGTDSIACFTAPSPQIAPLMPWLRRAGFARSELLQIPS